MCLRCSVKKCAPDFPGTFVDLLEPADLDECPRSFWLAAIRWFEEIERGERPECLACDNVFTPPDRPASLLCIVPPTSRHLFITGVCADCFPVVDSQRLAAHVGEVVGMPRVIRQSYN